MTFATRSRLALLLAALVVALLFDLLLGVAGAAVATMRATRAGAEGKALEQRYRIAHPYYHHDLAAGFEGMGAWGPIRYAVRTNSLGFRDTRVREVPNRTDRFRVLLLGDSFTEGLGIDYDSTFAGLLAAGFDARGVDILNAGVTSYSPAIYWKKAEYLLERQHLDVDAVVAFLDISDIQDDALVYRIDESGRVVSAPPAPYDLAAAWRHDSVVFQAVAGGMQRLYPHPPWIGCSTGRDSEDVIEAARADCRSGWTVSRVAMRRYGRDGLARADEHMTRLAGLLRLRGIALTVVVYPWPQQLQWNDRVSRQAGYWRAWAAREQAGFIDLFEVFFNEVDALGTAETIRRHFIPGDMHWNASGHRLVAGVVERHLASASR